MGAIAGTKGEIYIGEGPVVTVKSIEAISVAEEPWQSQ